MILSYFLDVIGVIHEASELSTFKTRMGESLTKKGVILVDISMYARNIEKKLV